MSCGWTGSEIFNPPDPVARRSPLSARFVLDECADVAEASLRLVDLGSGYAKVPRELRLRAPRDTVSIDVIEQREENECFGLGEVSITDAASQQPP